ncbi:DnaQ family exonuclease/DinG family helicase [Staphylococcus caeli]|uniref:DNA 5'-3' helicase n=1 Tax=Staphylococcus caeli TaxID=2201815 RepID=A0A1D4NFD1_9STAP|nr:ATP-dependent DNA helicase [Staphylococcus caeli]AWM30227.1 DNA polymerase III, epsilon subunit/ATP-dependent helicase DinG [Staphylococcus caeli]SCT09447.1 DnaQ family exonuclease/DinG family helicase [Staphylococcus caeli]SCT13563.1 DnaQ family exonuclease/DinG family helicase [Staphylococcus caeli]
MNYQRIYQEIDRAIKNMSNMGMETREGQENLMYSICESFEKAENVIVEAQVGIGKSFGYLIPGIIISMATNKPLIVASSTIQLTEQLSSDIKKVENILNVDIDCIVGKGVRNYPCFRKIHDNLKSEKLNTALDIAKRGLTKQEVNHLSIDWDGISTNRCIYEKCVHSQDCSFLKMRNQMVTGNNHIRLKGSKPKIIIVNQNLLLQHYKNKKTGKKGIIYENPCLIIIDEVHNLEENQRATYTTSINSSYCISILKSAINKFNGNKYYFECVRELKRWFDGQLTYIKSHNMYESKRVINSGRMEINKSNIINLNKLIENLEDLKSMIELKSIVTFTRKSKMNDNELDEIENIIKALEIIAMNDDDYVIWSEILSNNQIGISYCPSNPSKILKKTLFNGNNIVACFSATITSDSNEMDGYNYIIENIGFNGYYENVEKNEFPYDESRLYIPSQLPNHNNRDNEYYKEIAKHIYNISMHNSGGTMVLFTAKEDILFVSDELKKLNIQKCLYLDDGEVSQNEIIQNFKKTYGIILGTGVFWEGIDLKEKELTSLIIVRLPFPVPDPVIQRKIELLGDSEQVLVPEMIMKLKQGTGRLIRTSKDRGLLTILDSRMNNKNYRYRESILNSIPIKNKIDDSNVIDFLKSL